MSQAFVKERLHDVPPTLSALIMYLTRENNGIRVYEKKTVFNDKLDRETHLMSNGMTYTKDDSGKWYILE